MQGREMGRMGAEDPSTIGINHLDRVDASPCAFLLTNGPSQRPHFNGRVPWHLVEGMGLRGTNHRDRCSFCGNDRGRAAVMARADHLGGMACICHACAAKFLAALKGRGQPVPVECMELHCSFCGRHQAASRPLQQGPDVRICIYCLERARDRLEDRSPPEAESSDQSRPWRDVLAEMSSLMEQGRVGEYAARLGFQESLNSGEVLTEVAHAVRRLRGRTGLNPEDFASMVRQQTGSSEPTADQLVAWEAGWECLPIDLMLELACVATAYSRARARVGAGANRGVPGQIANDAVEGRAT